MRRNGKPPKAPTLLAVLLDHKGISKSDLMAGGLLEDTADLLMRSRNGPRPFGRTVELLAKILKHHGIVNNFASPLTAGQIRYLAATRVTSEETRLQELAQALSRGIGGI